jgi:hypothetical protein
MQAKVNGINEEVIGYSSGIDFRKQNRLDFNFLLH